MRRYTFGGAFAFVAVLCGTAFAQESAKVQATVQIPGKLNSFKDQQLEVLLTNSTRASPAKRRR